MADASLLRNWQMFCPRRYDMHQSNPAAAPGNVTLLGQVVVNVFPQAHDWRQQMGVVSMVPDGVDEPDDVQHVTGPDGYYCTRCIARLNDDGLLVRYMGDPEEMAAMRERQDQLLADMQAAREAAGDLEDEPAAA